MVPNDVHHGSNDEIDVLASCRVQPPSPNWKADLVGTSGNIPFSLTVTCSLVDEDSHEPIDLETLYFHIWLVWGLEMKLIASISHGMITAAVFGYYMALIILRMPGIGIPQGMLIFVHLMLCSLPNVKAVFPNISWFFVVSLTKNDHYWIGWLRDIPL